MNFSHERTVRKNILRKLGGPGPPGPYGRYAYDFSMYEAHSENNETDFIAQDW